MSATCAFYKEIAELSEVSSVALGGVGRKVPFKT
jgi:hypothetical protein